MINLYNLLFLFLNMIFKIDNIKIKEDNFPIGLKWIYVSFVIYFETTEEGISEIAKDITNIINNTHSIINKKGEYVGYVNPHLNLNYACLSTSEKGKIFNKINLYKRLPLPKEAQTFFPKDFPDEKTTLGLTLSRNFYPIIERIDKIWKLTFVPEKTKKEDKTNLYSIENLNNDLWMLAGASNLICERYGIRINEERPTYSPIIIEDAPALELQDHLLVIKYHVHDRIKFSKKNPKLDKFVLGNGETISDIIKKISKNEPNSIWVKKINGIREI